MIRNNILERIKNNILYKCIYNLIKHEAIEYAGYLTYLNVLSIFPFIFILFAFISIIDETQLGISFFNYIMHHLPPYVLETFGTQINEIINGPPISLMNVALIGAVWTASSSVEALKSIFNKIYLVQDKTSYIIGRITSVMQFLIIILLIIVTLTIFIIIPKILSILPVISQYQAFQFRPNYFLFNIILLLIVATIYYTLTNAKITFHSTLPGAIITIILWTISGNALSYYMTHFNQVSVMYGSLASIIITLMFLYIINLILILGAEFNHLLSKRNLLNK
jgi:membrane protein